MERLKRPETRRLIMLTIFFCVAAVPLLAVSGCGKQLARMEENQTKLQAMVAANARELATISSQLHVAQGKIDQGIQTLDQGTQQVAAGVLDVKKEQLELRETVVAGNDGLHRRIAQVEQDQQSLRDSVAQVSDVTQRTAADLTSLADRHSALHQTVQGNQQELTRGISTVVGNQQRMQTGISDLQQANRDLAGNVTTVAGKQDTLYTTVQNHTQTLADKIAVVDSSLQEKLSDNQNGLIVQIAGLSENQQHLQVGIDTLNRKAEQTTVELADTTSSLQDTIRISREVLTGQMAASLQNQQALQTDVRGLHEKADELTANVGEVSAEQAAQRGMLGTGHEAVITAMAGLSDGQEVLRSGIVKLDGRADRIAGDLASMTTQQQALHETVRANHDAVVGKLTDVSAGQTRLATAVNDLDRKADAAASAQDVFHQTLQSHNEAVDTGMAGLSNGQQTLRNQLDVLTTTTGQTATSVAALANGQQTLRSQLDTLVVTADQTAANVTALSNGQVALQQAVQAGTESLGERAGQITAGIDRVTEQQAAFRQDVKTNDESLAARMTMLAENQQVLNTGIGNLTDKTHQLSADVASATAAQDAAYKMLANGQQELKGDLGSLTDKTHQVSAAVAGVATAQDATHEMLASRSGEIDSRLSRLAQNQEAMDGELGVLVATTAQTGIDVIGLTKGQADLQQRVKVGNDSLASHATEIADNQQALKSGIEEVRQVSQRAASDVTTMAAAQDTLGQTLRADSNRIGEQVTRLANGQENMQAHFDTLIATAGQTTLDIITLDNKQTGSIQALQAGLTGLNERAAGMTTAMTAGQSSLHDALNRHSETMSGHIAKTVDGQQQIQSGLDILTATGGQTALDIIGMIAQQDVIRAALRDQGQAANSQMAKITDGQQEIQNGLDTVVAMTGQASLDVMALNNSQNQLRQTVQAGRQEMIDKLAVIAQDQQGWISRFDAAQAKVATMADSITTLERQITNLQGVLQTSIEDTTAVVGVTGQQRLQFETRVSQDVQAMMDSLTQLRQVQSLLQEQMMQVQKSTQGQAESIRSALEQMKQPPAELKVSDAKEKSLPAVIMESAE